MAPTVNKLLQVRAFLVEEILAYLEDLAKRMAGLPAYYPQRSQALGSGFFDAIYQRVQVIEDRKQYEDWLVRARERLKPAGLDVDFRAYVQDKTSKAQRKSWNFSARFSAMLRRKSRPWRNRDLRGR